MSSSLLLKVISGAAISGVTAGSVAFVSIKYDLFSSGNENNAKSIYVIAESTSDSDAETKDLVTTKEGKNYKCKFGDDKKGLDEGCIIKSIDISTNALAKKNINLKDLSNIKGVDPTQADLKTNKKYFKIEVSSDFYDEVANNNDDNKKIEVLLSKDATEGKKYGSLVPLFTVNGNAAKAKVLYSVGKITKFLNDSIEDATNDPITISDNNTKCIFTSDAQQGLGCEIFDFVETSIAAPHNSFSELTFAKGATKLGSITKNKYYLFKFTDNSSAKKDSALFLKNSKVKVSVTNPSGSNINTLEVSNLVPAISIDDSNPDFLFLLGNIK